MVDIQRAVLTKDTELIAEAYESLGKELNRGCSDCLRDAWHDLRYHLKNLEEPKAEINLFTMVYAAHTKDRQKELDECIERNEANEFIDRFIKIKSMATYDQIFQLTRQFPNDINIIANSDIWFDDSIERFRELNRLEVYALSRYDIEEGKAKLFYRADSQDVWAFRGAMHGVSAPYSQGRPGCDNNIAWRFKEAGFKVLNPAKSIYTYHIHKSNHRSSVNTHWNKVQSPYLLIEPTYLGEVPKYEIRR